MGLQVSNTRKCVVVEYPTDEVLGDSIEIVATNTETGDVGNRSESNNDGEALLFYPTTFNGTNLVTITGSDGGVVSGEIEITADVVADAPAVNGGENEPDEAE